MTNASLLIRLHFFNRVAFWVPAFLFLTLSLSSAVAQSTDQDIPTPVRAPDISATIEVRDLGDPRLTRHFFIFTGTPGDLVISVESKNLNGDVDIFTAGNFRPLVKISLFATESTSRTAKSIYLRGRQDLILRVEARSPNDEQGSYRIQFGGSFEPFSGEVAGSESATPADETPTVSVSGKKGRRVSAVGARINEPAAVVEEKAAGEQPTTESPSAERTEPAATNTEPPRTARSKRPNRRPPRPSRSKPASTAKAEPAATVPSEGEAKSGEPAQPAATEAAATQPPATPEPQAEIGPRLIIETKDGTRTERSMSTVRRVVVDNGTIIVILRTGKIERTPVASIVRMTIEP
jgi:hypothetical protein